MGSLCSHAINYNFRQNMRNIIFKLVKIIGYPDD